ncbi:hypothetical protein ACLESO_16555 [Pyxidicoccus sp. 3LG]
MREICEFRFDERDAQRHLRPDDGELIGLPGGGGVRKLVLEADDSRFARIGEIESQFKKKGAAFFTSWNIRRRYSKAEIEAAGLFHLLLKATVEPEGERCGTKYDDAAACPHCGAGARQINPLMLVPSSLPRAKDAVRTLAYREVLFSARLVEVFREHGITGARFHPVLRKGGQGVIDSWYQLDVCSRALEVVPPTRFGIDPFDFDARGEYRCPLGHVAGLNLLSELSVRRGDYDGADMCVTTQLVGPRSRNGGVFRPYGMLLISPKLRGLLSRLKLKGMEFEVAHLT